MNDHRLGKDFLHSEAWIEGGEGVLEDDLHVAAEAAHLGAVGGEEIFTFEADAAGCRLDQAQD
jgi:hypothetical protein